MDLKWIHKFINSLEIKYTKEWGSNKVGSLIKNKITDKTTKYLRLGYTQNPRKIEMAKVGGAITRKRGLQAYTPNANFFMGQRQMTPFVLSSPYSLTDSKIVCDGDDLHFVNNAAMQQMWDDIKRTCIVGFDLANVILEKRMDREVTPEVINYYLEYLNHSMPGAALVQENMVETHPALVDDCFVKIFTGEDVLKDELDEQFVIDIDKVFPPNQAMQIKAAIGKTSWMAVHIPTIVTRTLDGAATRNWATTQIGTTYLSVYGLGAGAAVSELAYAIQNAFVGVGDMLPDRRVGGSNQSCGLSFSHMADIVQTSRKTPDDPCHVVLQVATAASMLFDQVWLGGYQRGGAGFTLSALAAYTDDIVDDYLYWGGKYVLEKYGNFGMAELNLENIKNIATEVTFYGLENYEKYPTAMEDHFGGSQRATVIATAAGCSTAMATGHSDAGLSGWYLSMYLQKEAAGRLGDIGYDSQDQCGAANIFSLGSDEGCISELRGPNYPNYRIDVGHMGGYSAIVAAAHAGRKDAFCSNPLIKTCFADDLINFYFADPRLCFGLGALREWDRCAGERTFVIPAQ